MVLLECQICLMNFKNKFNDFQHARTLGEKNLIRKLPQSISFLIDYQEKYLFLSVLCDAQHEIFEYPAA